MQELLVELDRADGWSLWLAASATPSTLPR
jgi:hypothetical protein